MRSAIAWSVDDETSLPDFGAAYRDGMRRATLLLQLVIQNNKEFESRVSRGLGLNATDLAAVGEIMMSGPMSPTELAHRLGLTTAAVTTVVDRLAALDHVTRSQHPTDRRSVLVSATPSSVERAMRTILPAAHAIDSALDDFSPEESAVIVRYLERVGQRQREQMPE